MTPEDDGRVLFLTATDVERAMPPVEDRLVLAAHAMRALVADAELPPKVGLHPRPESSFAHAMPAFVRGTAVDGRDDLLGLKWVSGFPGNTANGLASILATILLSDPRTGRVRAVLDGGLITAQRTAAVSGVAIRSWFGEREAESTVAAAPLRVALVGAGVQARSHLRVLEHLVPGATLLIADRQRERAESVAAEGRASSAFLAVEATTDPATAIRGADIAITMVSFGPDRQLVPADAFEDTRLVVAVDYDMCVPAEIARRAASATRFVVDERGQFLANRDAGVFAGYPDPVATIGEVLLQHEREAEAGAGERSPGQRSAAPAEGPLALVTHLGVGVTDLVFADAIVRRAVESGLGTWVGASVS